MEEIRLQNEKWFYDPAQQLGPDGGFGAVFAGQSESGQRVAIKKLHLGSDASAHRELRVASLFENQSADHIVPIYDSGEDANSGRYFVVMALAEKSLQSDLTAGRKFSILESVEILKQIVEGLNELNGLVHRDLKPGNLLFHEGKWKIGDFGIARFVEESTSLNTLKDCLSPPFGAPEQWQYQRSEVATDLYAVGCIAYLLLSGNLPFKGPRTEDFRDQHLNKTQDELPASTPPKLKTLVGMLLRKSPSARPSLHRVNEILKNIAVEEASQKPPSHIAQAAARLEQRRAEEESVAAQLKAKAAAREHLAASGRAILSEINV